MLYFGMEKFGWDNDIAWYSGAWFVVTWCCIVLYCIDCIVLFCVVLYVFTCYATMQCYACFSMLCYYDMLCMILWYVMVWHVVGVEQACNLVPLHEVYWEFASNSYLCISRFIVLGYHPRTMISFTNIRMYVVLANRSCRQQQYAAILYLHTTLLCFRFQVDYFLAEHEQVTLQEYSEERQRLLKL